MTIQMKKERKIPKAKAAGGILIIVGLLLVRIFSGLSPDAPRVLQLLSADTLYNVPLQLQMNIPLLLGFLLTASGFVLWLLCSGKSDEKEEGALQKGPVWVFPGLIVLILAAAFLRFWRLSSLPPGFFVDEGFNALDGLNIALGQELPIYAIGNGGREVLFEYLMALSYLFFGATVFASRFPAAVAGVLTVPAVYILGREILRDRRWALLCAFFSAVSVWHLHFSRLPFRYVLLPLVCALSAAWMLEGLRTRKLIPWLLAGVALGLGVHTYVPIRLFPAVLLLILSGAWFRGERPKFLHLSACIVAAGLLTLPLVLFFLSDAGQVMQRVSQTLLYGPGRYWWPGILNTGSRTIAMFWLWGDVLVRHNCPTYPALNWATGAFFMLGLGTALRRFRKGPGPALVGWALVMSFPAMISCGVPSASRSLGAFPAVMILAAMGFRSFYNILSIKTARFFLFATLVFPVILGSYRYFITWPEILERIPLKNESVWGFSTPEAGLVDKLLPQGEPIPQLETKPLYFSPQLFLHPALQFQLFRKLDLKMAGNLRPDWRPSAVSNDRIILNVTRRNLWWIRNSPQKNMFLWQTAEYGMDNAHITGQIYHAYGTGAPVMDSDRRLLERLGEFYPRGRAFGLGEGFVMFQTYHEDAPEFGKGFMGWETDEKGNETWRWMGSEAEIKVHCRENCPEKLIIKGEAPIENLSKPPVLSLAINSKELFTQNIKDKKLLLNIDLPQDLQPSDPAVFRITVDETMIPEQSGLSSEDQRELGLRIMELWTM